MAQRSMWWVDGVGDGGPYAQDTHLRALMKALFGTLGANLGVLRGMLNDLAVTSTGNNNITVASGYALVDGSLYWNDASEALTLTPPTVGTTGKRVVLQKLWGGRTVRIAVVSSPDGTAANPALTQADGNTWEIPLASFSHATTGAISGLTSQREYVDTFGGQPFSVFWRSNNDGAGSGLDADLLDGIQGASYWHTANDGTGSGLDADLLDGSHASAFAAAAHTHNYLMDGYGTVSNTGVLSSSAGATSVTKNGTGDYTINGVSRVIASALTSGAYVCTVVGNRVRTFLSTSGAAADAGFQFIAY